MAEKSPENTRQYARQLFSKEFIGNRIQLEIKISSPEVNRIFRRHFDASSRCFFFVRFYAKILGGKVEIDASKHLSTIIDEAAANIKSRAELADKLIREGNIKAATTTRRTDVKAYSIDPLATRLLTIISQADDLTNKFYVLWLGCVLDDSQFRRANNEVLNIVRTIHQQANTLSLAMRHKVDERNSLPTAINAEIGETLLLAVEMDTSAVDKSVGNGPLAEDNAIESDEANDGLELEKATA